MSDTPGNISENSAKPKAPRRRMCFPKSRRILSQPVFQQTMKSGTGTPGRFLVVWTNHAEDCKGRVGIITTKKTFCDAVDRNRAKRLIRESVRLLQNNLTQKPWDMVIVARHRILSTKQPDVMRELNKICKKNGILGGY